MNVDRRVGQSALERVHESIEWPGTLASAFEASVIRTRYEWIRSEVLGDEVLEVGCGSGFGAIALAGRAKAVTCSDLANENLELLRQRVDRYARVVQLRAEALPFCEGSFDVIVAMAMVYYLDFPTFIKEARRTLRHGGRLLFCTSNCDVAGFVPAPMTRRYYTVPEMRTILESEGFSLEIKGAFPVPGGFEALSTVRGAIKNIIKSAALRSRYGAALWSKMRIASSGARSVLPSSIDEIIAPLSPLKRLSYERRDRVHRVLYVKATRD